MGSNISTLHETHINSIALFYLAIAVVVITNHVHQDQKIQRLTKELEDIKKECNEVTKRYNAVTKKYNEISKQLEGTKEDLKTRTNQRDQLLIDLETERKKIKEDQIQRSKDREAALTLERERLSKAHDSELERKRAHDAELERRSEAHKAELERRSEAHKAELEAHKAELERRSEAHEAELKKEEKKRKKLWADVEKFKNDYSEELKQRMKLEAEMAKPNQTQAELAAVKEELAEVKRNLETETSHRERLEGKVEKIQKDNKQMKQQILILTEQNTDLQSTVAHWKMVFGWREIISFMKNRYTLAANAQLRDDERGSDQRFTFAQFAKMENPPLVPKYVLKALLDVGEVICKPANNFAHNDRLQGSEYHKARSEVQKRIREQVGDEKAMEYVLALERIMMANHSSGMREQIQEFARFKAKDSPDSKEAKNLLREKTEKLIELKAEKEGNVGGNKSNSTPVKNLHAAFSSPIRST